MSNISNLIKKIIGNLYVFIENIKKKLRIATIRLKFRRIKLPYTFNKVIILVPHPDDEVFGCSGLIQQLSKLGKDVYIMFMTCGEAAHSTCCNMNEEFLKDNRIKLAYEANSLFSINKHNLIFLGYKDGEVSYASVQTKKTAELVHRINPDVIFVPHLADLHKDHLATRQIGMNLAPINCQVYEYCVWFWYNNIWSIDWKNSFYIQMSKEEIKIKRKAIETYVKPLAPCGHPWSGILPSLFVETMKWKNELFFRIK